MTVYELVRNCYVGTRITLVIINEEGNVTRIDDDSIESIWVDSKIKDLKVLFFKSKAENSITIYC